METNNEPFRCPWCLKFEQYIKYHDEEWGVPVHDEHKLD
jgi:DNA-3-methyladenine glycosylase I